MRTILCLSTVVLCVAGGCKKSQRSTDTTTSMGAVAPDTAAPIVAATIPAGPGVELTVATKPGVGMFLTDASGHALYVLDSAATGRSAACTGDCATKFTPVTGQATSKDSKVDQALIGVITLPDGTTQVTYNGKPLFVYKADVAANDTKAQGQKTAGATSRLVTPTGKEVGAK
jgi:predicted lipoprotein with Yx(FWY)xxD motif